MFIEHWQNRSLQDLSEIIDGLLYVEEWNDIPGYVGLYKASTFGRIKRLNRIWESSTGERSRKEEIIIPTKNPWGYLYVELSDNNKYRKKIFVHVLVAKTWIPNRNNYPEVDHKWKIRHDNRISELEWVTKSENQKRSYVMGRTVNKTQLGKTGSLNTHSIPINQLSLTGEFIKKWSSQAEAAKSLGLSQGNIYSAIKGSYKQTGGYKWEYAK